MNASRLGLGTVQFGLPYGVSNARGQVDINEAARILDEAHAAGVRTLDTAAQYGEAEQVLNQLGAAARFDIVTKCPPLGADGSAKSALAAVEQSLKLFAPHRPLGVLMHHASDLDSDEGKKLWDGLQALKRSERIRRVGFSCYFEDAPVARARALAPDMVQLPLSVLDQRPIRSGVLADLSALGVAVHARSVFLQGLLFLKRGQLPESIADAGPAIERARARMMAAGATPVAGALAFALAWPEVERVIVGVTSVAELRELISASEQPLPDLDWRSFALDNDRALTPSRWSAAS